MKLDEKTVEILRNFQSINPSIILEEGDIIRTMTPTKTIFAQAKIDQEITTESAVYDLSKFLGLLTLNKEPEIDFDNEDHITIKGDKNTIKFRKANPTLIAAPPKGKSIKMKSKDVVFNLPYDIVKDVIKAMSIMGFAEIIFAGKDGKLSIMTTVSGRDDADYYSAEIGETDKNFVVIVDADKFKLLPRDYEVVLSSQGLVYLKSDDGIEYWLSTSKNSKFE